MSIQGAPHIRPWQRLYVRIWLAVVAVVALLIVLVSWAWRVTAEPPLREVHIRDHNGLVIGSGMRRSFGPPPLGVAPPLDTGDTAAEGSPWPPRPPGPPMQGYHHPRTGSDAAMHLPDLAGGGPRPMAEPGGRRRAGPEFLVRMADGQTVFVHLPRPPERSPFGARPYGFLWLIGLVGLGVALATYPIVRHLTRRLEALQGSVDRWGTGDLSARVAVQGSDEIAALADRFNHAAQRIEALVGAHKTLLANASHELRSPLTRIRMGLELMGTSSTPGFKAEITRNIAELDQLIDEILLASRLDSREADMGTAEPVDMLGLCAEECARCDAEFTPQPNCAEGATVQGVDKLLRRLVRNLLENARRYSQGAIQVTLARPAPERLVLQVCDHGPGVPEALRERIFEPFYRLPGASEQAGGVGLGLALVRSIAERHGGSVRCTGNPGGGACFVVELPTSSASFEALA